jgi:DNA (cytosine-5)-methyltransferase 1
MLTIEDHFCGAGGNTTGALLVEDVEVVHAANHSVLAINTHSSNYPSVEHTCGDIRSMEPKRYPSADVLITTPSCAARSYARGRPKDDPHLFKSGDGLDEKSRATMD